MIRRTLCCVPSSLRQQLSQQACQHCKGSSALASEVGHYSRCFSSLPRLSVLFEANAKQPQDAPENESAAKRFLRNWSLAVWAGGMSFLVYIIYPYAFPSTPKEQEEEEQARRLELDRKRKLFVPAVLAGASVIHGDDDIFKGLSPQEIQRYVDENKGDASVDDPFSGLTPEQIDAYVTEYAL